MALSIIVLMLVSQHIKTSCNINSMQIFEAIRGIWITRSANRTTNNNSGKDGIKMSILEAEKASARYASTTGTLQQLNAFLQQHNAKHPNPTLKSMPTTVCWEHGGDYNLCQGSSIHTSTLHQGRAGYWHYFQSIDVFLLALVPGILSGSG